MKRMLSSIAVIVFLAYGVVATSAQTSLSSSYTIRNPVITSGLTTGSSLTFGLGQSLGQRVVGKATSSNFKLWSGYQYYTIPTRFTVLATSAMTTTGAVILQWATPVIPSGEAIVGYDIGIGTTPYSYTFQNVGAVTSFTKSGLTNGVTYYAIVRAKKAGGSLIAYSNQVSVLPSGTSPIGGGGGGGGGSSSTKGSVHIKGLAYPNTRVVILKDGVIAATTVADPGAAFSVELDDLNSGKYTFGVYAEDSKGLKSTTFTFPVTVDDSITVTIDNVFLAPTIGVSSKLVKQGEPIGIFGTTAPSATITLHVHSAKEFVELVTATVAGVWFKQFDTSLLEKGGHITYSRSALNDRVTDQSATVAFAVGDTTIPNDTSMRSDLNNDKKVNIADFSMLLFYWRQNPPASSKADITKDGTVDISDLSIMLYDWTG